MRKQSIPAKQFLAPLLFHLVDLGSHFGAHWILEGSPKMFKHQHTIIKMRSNKRVQKHIMLLLIVGAQMVGLKKWKRGFRIIHVAISEV